MSSSTLSFLLFLPRALSPPLFLSPLFRFSSLQPPGHRGVLIGAAERDDGAQASDVPETVAAVDGHLDLLVYALDPPVADAEVHGSHHVGARLRLTFHSTSTTDLILQHAALYSHAFIRDSTPSAVSARKTALRSFLSPTP